MKALPEGTTDATRAALERAFAVDLGGETWEEVGDVALAAAIDPRLGPARLVVAGPFERQVARRIVAWLRTDGECPAADAVVADVIEAEFT